MTVRTDRQQPEIEAKPRRRFGRSKTAIASRRGAHHAEAQPKASASKIKKSERSANTISVSQSNSNESKP